VLYVANPSTSRIRAVMSSGQLGCIITPKQGNHLPAGCLWLADNGCGPDKNGLPGTGYPGDERYLGLLQDLWDEEGSDFCDPDTSGALFAAAPDVLADAAATLRRSSRMLGWIRHIGFPAALVAQNGLEHLTVPWDDFDVLFLGGSAECVPCGYVRTGADRDLTRCPYCQALLAEWKLGAAARELVREAKRRDLWVHMGRVNSLKRLRYAALIGCDSADGTYLVRTRNPDKYLPVVLGWQRAVNAPAPAGLFDLTARPA
jgi:hypothetical protein